MAKSKLKPSLAEIATHSGVSAATVSRILNHSGTVSRDLVERVNQSLVALGFEHVTKGYVAAICPMAGIVTPKMEGIITEAERLGYTIVILYITGSTEINQRSLQLFKILNFQAVIILTETIKPEDLRNQYQLGNVPIVVVNHRVELATVHCIDIDRVVGMYKAVKHLMSLGHRKFAYLSAPLETRVSLDRKKGIDQAMEENGLTYIFRQSDASAETGFQMTTSVMKDPGHELPTAIVTFDDQVAVGSLEALKAMGLRVPEDVSVIGFDDQFITRHTSPPLTTVHQPWVNMGKLAMAKVDSVLSGRDLHEGGLTVLECPLIVRESTGPAPKS